MLIETADGVISGGNSPEQLIVASNDVAASTAQLVAASRVKATFMSKTQDTLETASKAVTNACRSLVRQVQDIIAQRNRDDDTIDYAKLSSHEFKVREMEQQVFHLWVNVSRPLTSAGRNPSIREWPSPGQATTGRDAQSVIPGIIISHMRWAGRMRQEVSRARHGSVAPLSRTPDMSSD